MNDDTIKAHVATLTDEQCIEVLEEIKNFVPEEFDGVYLLVNHLHQIEAEIYHRFTSRPGTLIGKTRHKE